MGSAQVHQGATLSHHGKDAVAAAPGRSCRQEKKHNLAAPSSEYRRDGAPCRSEGFSRTGYSIPGRDGPGPGAREEIGVRGFPARDYFILGRDGAGARWLGKVPCRRRATGSGCGGWGCARVILSPDKDTSTEH